MVLTFCFTAAKGGDDRQTTAAAKLWHDLPL